MACLIQIKTFLLPHLRGLSLIPPEYIHAVFVVSSVDRRQTQLLVPVEKRLNFTDDKNVVAIQIKLLRLEKQHFPTSA